MGINVAGTSRWDFVRRRLKYVSNISAGYLHNSPPGLRQGLQRERMMKYKKKKLLGLPRGLL